MRPVLLFDGDCGMCSSCARLVARRLRRSPDDFDVVPSRTADLRRLGLTQEQCDKALQWVAADGTISSGHEAVAALLRASRRCARPVGRLMTLPGVDAVARHAYEWVAGHRQLFPGGTPACSSPGTQREP